MIERAESLDRVAQESTLVPAAEDREQMSQMARSVVSKLEGGVANLVNLAAMAVDSGDFAGAEIKLLEAQNASVRRAIVSYSSLFVLRCHRFPLDIVAHSITHGHFFTFSSFFPHFIEFVLTSHCVC